MEADGWGVWDGLVHSAVSRMGHYQGPTVQHRELSLSGAYCTAQGALTIRGLLYSTGSSAQYSIVT